MSKTVTVSTVVNNYVSIISLYGDLSNYIYYGDHFEKYRNTKSLCHVTGTNIMWYISYTSKQTNKFIEKEIRFVVTRGRRRGKGNWMKVVKRYKLLIIR